MDDFEIKNGELLNYNGAGRNVVIPEGVTSIGTSAFKDCRSLISIIISERVTSIGSDAFNGCSSLTSITIPKGVTSIGERAFNYCRSLTDITIPKGVTSIGSGAFRCCSSLTGIIIPEEVTCIEKCVFEECRGLTSIIIPEGVTSIGERAFSYCSSLTGITIPEGVTSIGERAFSYCSSLTDITIPEGVMNIERGAFEFCRGLTSITIPEGVTSIGSDAFNNCGNLARVYIPKGVTYIERDAFQGCSNLKEVCIDSLKDWLKISFARSSNPLSFGATLYIAREPVTEISLPDNIKEIRNECFYDYKILKKVHIHDKLKSIGENSFARNTMLIMDVYNGWDVQKIPKFETSLSIVINRKNRRNESVEKIVACVNGDNWPYGNNLEELNLISGKNIDYVKYDQFVINGSRRFKLNAEEKLRAAMYRLRYPNDLEDSYKHMYVEICKKNIKKLITIAMEEDKETIITLFREGVIIEKAKNDVLKLLASSSRSEIKELATTIDDILTNDENSVILTNCNITDTETPLQKEYRTKLAKYDGVSQLVKMGLNDSSIPDVVLADSESNAPKEILQFILSSYGSLYISPKKYSAIFLDEADKAAKLLDRASFQNALEIIYENVDKMQFPQIILPYCRYTDYKGICKIIKNIAKWHSFRESRQVGRNIEALAIEALLLSDTKEAMVFIDGKKLLSRYAKLRNIEEDVVRDKVLAEFGLDVEGRKKYDLNGKIIVVTLEKDLSLSLFDETNNKTIRSIPKRGTDLDLAEKAHLDFSELKRNIKKFIKIKFDILFDDFLSGRKKSASIWKETYPKNPVLRQVAKLIVWGQGEHSFILADNGIVDCYGNLYEIDENLDICVAHPMEMKPEEVKAWQIYFTKNGLKQPFIQIWEPVIDKSTIQEKRYADYFFSYYKFKNKEKHGICIEDLYFHSKINVKFKDCDIEAYYENYGRHEIDANACFEIPLFRFSRYTRQTNHIVAYLDTLKIETTIEEDETLGLEVLQYFTLAQITHFIDVASDAKAYNALAYLMQYKQNNFEYYDPIDDFILEW